MSAARKPWKCAVVGKPIAHSLSPAMHRAAYAALGLDNWTYDAFEVDEAGLKGFLENLDESWVGLSLTMPLKRAVIGFADEVTEVAGVLQVANTLEVGGKHRIASNTDCAGASGALAERGIGDVTSIRVLGGGATAASIVYALARKPRLKVEFLVRDEQRAAESIAVAERAGADVTVRPLDAPMLEVVDLLVSTVPAKAVKKLAHDLVDASNAVFDVVYEPWPTPLASAAAHEGVPYASGLDLLAHQAALQVELFTGQPIDPRVLRDAALEELARR